MKNSQNFPEIRRKSCENCSKLHKVSGSCVDPNVLNIYAPRQAAFTECLLFIETRQEHFPDLTLENDDD